MSASCVPLLQAVDINQCLAERLILRCSVKEQMVEQLVATRNSRGIRICRRFRGRSVVGRNGLSPPAERAA
jgi:hypothetical protein